jgi:hypothetical protein
MQPDQDRVGQRAEDGPAEERTVGSDDPAAQAAAVLADSEERQASREESGGTVEHRTPSGDR